MGGSRRWALDRMKEALLANPKANLPWVCEERPDLLDSEVRAAFLCTHRAVLDACCSECGKWYPEEWWVGRSGEAPGTPIIRTGTELPRCGDGVPGSR